MKIRISRRARLAAGLAVVALSLTATSCGSPVTQTEAALPTPSAATTTPAGQASATPTPAVTATPTPTPAATSPSMTPKPATQKPQRPATQKPATQKPQKPATQKPAPKPIMAKGDSGDKVRELQARLKQLQWYEGKITGSYGDITVTAVRGFQQKRKISATGAVDQASWDALITMTRQPTDDELHNKLTAGPAILKRGSTGDKVRELQARLKQLDWFSGDITPNYGSATETAVKGFQGKRELPVTGEVDKRTWDRLVGMTRTPTKNELNNVRPKPSANGLDSRCLTGRALCISKSTNTLVWVVNGTPQIKVDVRFGSYETPTREGAFSVGWKARAWTSTIYHTSMPYAMFFSGGQAVHYSADFAARGYTGASHGCVNVRDLGAIRSLFDQVRVGDKVIVYR